jgi:hypothetical protein
MRFNNFFNESYDYYHEEDNTEYVDFRMTVAEAEALHTHLSLQQESDDEQLNEWLVPLLTRLGGAAATAARSSGAAAKTAGQAATKAPKGAVPPVLGKTGTPTATNAAVASTAIPTGDGSTTPSEAPQIPTPPDPQGELLKTAGVPDTVVDALPSQKKVTGAVNKKVDDVHKKLTTAPALPVRQF